MKVAFLLALFSTPIFAQRQELALTLGRFSGLSRSAQTGPIDLDSGVALQANYGYRLWLTRHAAFSAEVHFLANGQRRITSADSAVTRDVATLFVTPGLRMKLHPGKRVSPYAVAGAGYALYEQSFYRQDGASNEAPRFTHRGAVMYGGGMDASVWKWIGVRFEVRDFYTGNPSFNVPVNNSGQHNVVVGGGLVLSWGGRERSSP